MSKYLSLVGRDQGPMIECARDRGPRPRETVEGEAFTHDGYTAAGGWTNKLNEKEDALGDPIGLSNQRAGPDVQQNLNIWACSASYG